MSIDLKAHGLRVKPLEFVPWGRGNKRATCPDFVYTLWEDGDVEILCCATHDMTCHRPKNGEIFCQQHHESQVLALLDQVEGGQ